HVTNPEYRLVPMTEEKRKQIWVNEVSVPMDAPTAERCMEIVYPDRTVRCLAFGWPTLDMDLEKSNEYIRTEGPKRNWPTLTLLRPQWSAEQLAAELDHPGVVGVKPYYALIGQNPETRDQFLEASIFDFLPHTALEVLNDRRAWVTLHVPKADRLGHPDNIAEVREIRRRYPDIILVLPHFGRCYTLPHAEEALSQLAGDPGLYFDCSAVLNPDVLRLAFETFGPQQILYGTDNPIFYMRGRRQWDGRKYINRTSYPFHFNTNRESPEIEATYTLFMYEALLAIRQTCEALNLTREQVEAIFCGNAERLIGLDQ
ncbi:MAG TPA: hypothetical protein ENL03_06280, partial [Phycisphaerae bacterium]|nr:hypothetical protein [Phycisphaerae bacterium]